MLNYSGGGARDPEDLAVDKDGTSGSPTPVTTQAAAPTVAHLEGAGRRQHPDASTATRTPTADIDAEAMLLDGDGTPIIVTKDAGGPAQIYVADRAAAQPNNATGVPLKQAGTFTPQKTDTPNKFGGTGADAGHRCGAVSPTAAKPSCAPLRRVRVRRDRRRRGRGDHHRTNCGSSRCRNEPNG